MKFDYGFKQDIADWFEYGEKCLSGGLGYPSGSNFEPSSRSSKLCDPTPNHALPTELVFIHSVMLDMPKVYYRVLEQKYANSLNDKDRADALSVSVAKYYSLCNQAFCWVAGNYNNQFSDRRKKTYLHQIN